MPSISRNGFSLILLALLALGWQPAFAQTVETEAVQEGEDPEDSVSGSLDDSSGSIEAAHDPLKHFVYEGWQRSGDLRLGYVRSESDERDGSEGTESDWRARLRYGGSYNVNDWLIFNGRFAVACTSRDCDPELSLDPSETQVTTVDQGTITFDEFYLHAFRLKRFDVAIGRLQTKFTTRAGVYAKSLDRNNSNSVNIN
jgi:hypothetical protein